MKNAWTHILEAYRILDKRDLNKYTSKYILFTMIITIDKDIIVKEARSKKEFIHKQGNLRSTVDL